MHTHSSVRAQMPGQSVDVPAPWAPLSKAQCLLMAIQLRRVREETRQHWGLAGNAPPDGARFESDRMD